MAGAGSPPSLVRLSIDASGVSDAFAQLWSVLPVGAPRKRASTGHGGARIDSGQHTMAAILLSRVLKTTDDSVLGGAASAPYAITLLQQLRGLFLAMARREGSTALEAAQVQTLFSMAGSTILSRQAYGTLLSLPCRLPFDRAQDLVRRLVEAVTAVRATDEGAQLAGLSSENSPQAEMAATVEAFVQAVRVKMTAASAASSTASSAAASTAPTQPPSPPRLPAPQMPCAIDPTSSLVGAIEAVLSGRVGMHLAANDAAAILQAMEEALSFLTPAPTAERRALLQRNVLSALVELSAAQLYATVLRACASDADADAAGSAAPHPPAHPPARPPAQPSTQPPAAAAAAATRLDGLLRAVVDRCAAANAEETVAGMLGDGPSRTGPLWP